MSTEETHSTDSTSAHGARFTGATAAATALFACLFACLFASACGPNGWLEVEQGGEDEPNASAGDDSATDENGSARTGDGSNGSNDGSTSEDPPPEKIRSRLEPGRMWRLTRTQIENSIRQTFAPEVEIPDSLPPDETVERFLSMGASKVGTSSKGAQQYRNFALELAEYLLENHRDTHPALTDCTPDGADDPCIDELVRSLGEDLWRRPLTDAEVDRYASVVGAAEEGDHADLGLRYALAGLLQSPQFLYIAQPGEPSGQSGIYRYTDWEMASRLSFFIWNHPPDSELRRAARDGELRTADQIESQTRRMLDDAKATNLAYRFFSQAWDVDELTAGLFSSEVFPNWSEELVRDYKREFRLVLRDLVFERDADIRKILTGDFTYANAELTEIYETETDVEEEGFHRVELPDRRTGLLTSGAVIASNSSSKHFLPVHRGVFVLRRILCTDPPPPTDEAVMQAEEIAEEVENNDETLTPREIMEQHANDPECAACHDNFDPMGHTFGHFDQVGQWMETYEGKPIDSTGELGDETFESVPELASYLAENERTGRCIAENLYSFATGEAATDANREVIERLADNLESHDYSFEELVVDIVRSDSFRYAAPPGHQRETDE